MSNVKVTRGEEILWQQLYDDGMTLREIAEGSNVTAMTVRAHINVTREGKPRGRQDITVEDAVRAVEELGSQRKAAAELGCSLTTIRQRFWEAGLGPDPTAHRKARRAIR